jgi:hypothetical protein
VSSRTTGAGGGAAAGAAAVLFCRGSAGGASPRLHPADAPSAISNAEPASHFALCSIGALCQKRGARASLDREESPAGGKAMERVIFRS